MSSFAHQPIRHQPFRAAAAESATAAQSLAVDEAENPSTSIDLFPAASNSLHLHNADEWSFILPPTSTSTSISPASTDDAADPDIVESGADSLGFPSHQGGVFHLSDSLVISEGAPSLYASINPLGSPSTLSSGTGTAASLPSSEDQLPGEEDWIGLASPRSLSEFSVSDDGPSSVVGGEEVGERGAGGGSRLTERSLQLQDESTYWDSGALMRLPGAGFTSGSSAEEEQMKVLQPRRGRRGNGLPRRLVASRRYDEQEDSDEELFSGRTRMALGLLYKRKSKGGEGANGGTQGRDAYPSPPEGIVLSGSNKAGKRRHRRSGGAHGSQKRSSTSGSLSATSLLSRPSSPTLLPLPLVSETPSKFQLELQARSAYSKDILLGPSLARVMDLDTSTLELLAATSSDPTPTSSRVASPFPSPRSRSSTFSHHRVTTSYQSFSLHARDEMGLALHSSDAEMLAEESSTETEREVPHGTLREGAATWYREYRSSITTPPSPSIFQPPEDSTHLHRSLSLSALPSYLAGSALPSSFTSSLFPSSTLSNSSVSTSTISTPTHATRLRSPPSPAGRALRRPSSFTSGQSESGRSGFNTSSPRDAISGGAVLGGADGGGVERVNEPWGADFDGGRSFGLEEALGYWRRILRGLRGF